MAATKEANAGDYVDVVSGPHEGRHGTIVRLHPQSVGMYGEAEWFALIKIQAPDFEGTVHEDEIAVPVRRLKPR